MIRAEIAGIEIGDNLPVRIMGVINLSPESFYKGSVVTSGIKEAAQRMVDEGADFIDIGARSTWPLAPEISKEAEKERLLTALDALSVDVPVSVDTMYHDIAGEALGRGADIINDVSGFTQDALMVEVAREYACPVVLMAGRTVPGDAVGMDAVMEALSGIIARVELAGIEPGHIIIDPAFGKWVPEKAPEHDFETLRSLSRLRVLGKPILAAVSRKSFIGETLGKPPEMRLFGSIAAAALAVHNGAHIVRTHDVSATVDAVRIAEKARRKIVSGDNIEILMLSHPDDAARAMRSLGATAAGSLIMKNKAVLKTILIRNITSTEALIIKQEMLARGGDAALPKEAISHEKEHVDVLICGTLLQVQRLVAKLSRQSRSLPAIAELLRMRLEEEGSYG
ncbi:MAG TPA: dihydropteroate synthase [Candidatus Methanoperedenaceae archaeon]|nr:dihydropteroate synthase [Candidatus Methanoperedenaceae archaeon]